jgi:hypothetical protein
MSGCADKAVSHHGVSGVGSHLIGKPFTVDELRGKVREVLEAG